MPGSVKPAAVLAPAAATPASVLPLLLPTGTSRGRLRSIQLGSVYVYERQASVSSAQTYQAAK